MSDSRFKIVSRAELLPPACSLISRRSDDEWYLDVGHFEDYYGVVYFGASDFDEMARTAGYIPESEVGRLKTKNTELKRDLDSANAKLAEFESIRRTFMEQLSASSEHTAAS